MSCAICGEATDELYEYKGQEDLCWACMSVAQDLTQNIHDTDTCDIPGCPDCRAIHRDLEADRRLDEAKGN